MGTEGAWVPVVMSLVAAGSQYADQRSQQRRADRIALQSLQQSDARQRRADAATNQMLDELRQSSPEDERESTMRGFLEQLSRAEPRAMSGLRARGGESEAFRRDAEAAALGVSSEGARHAEIASRLDAPALQRQREGRTIADLGINLGALGREQQGDDRQADLLLRGIRSNPWLQALSAAAGAYGQSYQPAAASAAAGSWGTSSPISGVSNSPYMGDSAFGPWGRWVRS